MQFGPAGLQFQHSVGGGRRIVSCEPPEPHSQQHKQEEEKTIITREID